MDAGQHRPLWRGGIEGTEADKAKMVNASLEPAAAPHSYPECRCHTINQAEQQPCQLAMSS